MKNIPLNYRKLILNLVIPISFLALVNCGPTNYMVEEIKNFDDLKQFLQQKEFEIENQWANPLRGANINLITNPNFIRFKGDSVEIFLPYFGVRQMGGGYNNRGGIKFEGIPKQLEITENKEKNFIQYKFKGHDESEDYQFLITLYPNGNANTSVNSTQRDNISYTGRFNPLKEEE